MRKIKRQEWMILLFNVIYLIIFAILYASRANYEFLLYIGVLIFFIILVSIKQLKYNFPIYVLIGLSIWGLMHMCGGYLRVGDGVLYGYWLLPFLRFDQFVHAFGFGFAALFCYYILKPNLSSKYSRATIYILTVLMGMGLGALNEIVEFTAVLLMPQTGVGGYENTMWDIVFNTIGSIIAVTWLNFIEKNKKK